MTYGHAAVLIEDSTAPAAGTSGEDGSEERSAQVAAEHDDGAAAVAGLAAGKLAGVPARQGRTGTQDLTAVAELLAADPVVDACVTAVTVTVHGTRAYVSVNAELDQGPDGVRPAERVAALLGLDEPPEGLPGVDELRRGWTDHEFTRTFSTAAGSVRVTVTGREAF
jgi:hypothetical protein